MPDPAQFTTFDGTLSGAINNSNRTYAFIPQPLTVFYNVPNALTALVFRNGQLLDIENGDYTESAGSFTLSPTPVADVITAEFYRNFRPVRYRLLPGGGLAAISNTLLRIAMLPIPPGPALLFRSGQLLTAGVDYVALLPYFALINNVAIQPTDFWELVMTGGTTASTADGSITGTLNGSNPNFTLPSNPANLMLFRNGQLLTSGLDYTRSGAALVMSATQVPLSADTLTGQLFTGSDPLQVTTNDGGLYWGSAAKIMGFYNGVLMTPQVDITIGANSVSLAQGPPKDLDVVTVRAWTPDQSDVAPLNLSTRYTTLDGSISGALDRHNKVYTLRTDGLITAVMLWWNGDFQTPNVDYLLAGNVITMLGTRFPRNTDILTAEVFSQ